MIRRVDPVTGEELAVLRHEDEVWAVEFSPDGSWFVTCGFDDVARIWDAKTAQLRLTLKGHEHRLLTVAVSPDGKTIVTILDVSDRQRMHLLAGSTLNYVKQLLQGKGKKKGRKVA